MSKLRVLTTELILFLAIQLLGLFAASKLIRTYPEIATSQPIPFLGLLVAFIFATAFVIIALKFLKGRIGFKLLFLFLLVFGTKTIFSAFTPDLVASILTLIVVIIWVALPYVWMHNIAIILAIAGISAELGFIISVSSVLILLAILSVYDVIAVYRTEHMVKMFKKMMDKGVLLSIAIPINLKDFFKKTSDVKPRSGFLLLGTGDLAFPLVFAVAALKLSLISSLMIIAGSSIGAAIVFYLLIHQVQHRALPALPPIAICSAIAFIISLFIV